VLDAGIGDVPYVMQRHVMGSIYELLQIHVDAGRSIDRC
jgi:hypothetical protein